MTGILEYEFTTAPAVFTALGFVALGMTLLPRLLHQRPLSFPIIYVVAGWLMFSLPARLPHIDPVTDVAATEHLTETGVIVALFAVGLKIGRPVSWKGWGATWRLLGIAIPLTIAAASVMAAWMLGFDLATALLFGAALAPTDPVLASDVQQPSPQDEGPGEVRFVLTSEAGLNDALAFPFTMAAIAIATSGSAPSAWLVDWLVVDVAYRIVVGLIGGWIVGRILRYVVFQVPVNERRLAQTGEGLIAVAGTFLAYGITEIAEGYGFLAVFVAAQVIRSYEREHDYHSIVHDFAEQIERLTNGIVLVLFGAAIANGLLDHVTPATVGVTVLMIVVVRPLTAAIALGGLSRGRWITSFFGIRGVGSFFYLAYALNHEEFAGAEEIWSAVGLTVLASIAIHGLTSGPAMRRYDQDQGARDDVDRAAEAGVPPAVDDVE